VHDVSAVSEGKPTPDLLSLVLALRPADQAEGLEPTPTWWGRAAHALLLRVLREADANLAAALHDEEGPRPFTVSSLLGPMPEGRLAPDGSYTLRLTALCREVAERLLQATQDGPLAAGRTVELDYRPFRVTAATWQDGQHRWAGATTYAELAAARLASGPPVPRQIVLQFTSPTTFKSQERHMPIPLPELVFGSLWERWNAFAPIAFPPEVRRYAAECLAVGRFHLSSRAVPMKEGGMRVGGVGQITYVSLNYDRYWMSVMHTLAAYALYAGVGAGTTMGLGQCRQVKPEEAL